MNPRTTGIFFVLAAALGLFVYFYEIAGEEGRDAAEQASKRLFPGFESAQITALEFTGSDDVAVRVERPGGATDSDAAPTESWRLTAPLDFPGDDLVLDGMASALESMTREAIFEDPQALEVYELGPEAPLLHFEVGATRHTLRVGKKAPVGSNTYVAVGGQSAVYTVSTFAVNALTKTLDEVRDKRIARFDTNSIERVAVSWPGGGVTLERVDEVWRMLVPLETPGDSEVVEALLSDLSFLRADAFEDAPAPDAEIGLDPPALSVVLTGAGAGEGEGEGNAPRVEVAIGNETGEGERLVRGALPTRYRISAERLDDYPRDVTSYRWKELTRFAPVDAAKVELVFSPRASTDYGDGPVTITATRQESGWVSEPETLAVDKIAGMLSRLATLRAEGILADELGAAELAGMGLEPANARVRIFDDEGAVLADVRIGRLIDAERVAAQAEGNPIVYELDPGLAEFVPVSFEAFRNRFVAVEEVDAPIPDEVAGDAAIVPDDSGDSP